MDKLGKFEQELISGYLDDSLSGSEREQAGELLANNPLAEAFLSELRSTRDCLRGLAQPKLPRSLASRVLELAQQQALAEGLPAEHHVMLAARTTTQPTTHPAVNTSASTGLAEVGLAEVGLAEVGLAEVGQVAAEQVAPVQVATSPIATAQSVHSDAGKGSIGFWSSLAALAAGLIGVAVYVGSGNHSQSNGLVDQVVVSPKLPKTGTEAETESGVSSEELKPNPFHKPDGGPTGDPSTIASTGNDLPSVAVRNNSNDKMQLELDNTALRLDMLFVIDVVMSPEAWDAGRFDKMLAAAGLPVTRSLKADKELLTALLESRMVMVNPESPGKQANVAMIFAQCKAGDLERIAVEVENDRQSFKSWSYDLGIDDKRMVLSRLLRKQAGKPNAKGEARMIVPDTDSGDLTAIVPTFTAPAKETVAMPSSLGNLDARASFMGMPNLDAEVLFVLRRSE